MEVLVTESYEALHYSYFFIYTYYTLFIQLFNIAMSDKIIVHVSTYNVIYYMLFRLHDFIMTDRRCQFFTRVVKRKRRSAYGEHKKDEVYVSINQEMKKKQI